MKRVLVTRSLAFDHIMDFPESFEENILPEKIDNSIAHLKLKAMGISIDRLTREQKTYLTSWQEGM